VLLNDKHSLTISLALVLHSFCNQAALREQNKQSHAELASAKQQVLLNDKVNAERATAHLNITAALQTELTKQKEETSSAVADNRRTAAALAEAESVAAEKKRELANADNTNVKLTQQVSVNVNAIIAFRTVL
jgi:hypothetical protein